MRFDAFDPNPDPRYSVSVDKLLPGGSWMQWRRTNTHAKIIEVKDRYITGKFDLRAANLPVIYRFENCRFEVPPDVREANLSGLVFRRCWLPGLKARNLRSRNDVRLIRCRVEVEEGHATSSDSMMRGALTERGLPDAAVNLTDAVVEGSVVLSRTRLAHPRGKAIQADRLVITGALLAYRLKAFGEFRVPGMRTGGNVNFAGAKLRNAGGFALNANGVNIGGSLLCEIDPYGRKEDNEDPRTPFEAKGMLYLPGARIAGDIVFTGAKLEMRHPGGSAVSAWQTGDWYVDPRPTLFADRLHVEGNVELSDDLHSIGTLRLVNAHFGGSLRLAKATIKVERSNTPPWRDRAVHLDGSEINGDLDAKGLNAEGQLRLADVTVRGNLLIHGGKLEHPWRDAVSLRRSNVFGNVWLSGCTVCGTVRMQGMTVGGNIDLRGTQVTQPELSGSTSWSCDLRQVQAQRHVVLSNDREVSFFAEGGVTLDGAVIKHRVDLTGAVLGSRREHRVALDLGSAVADEFVLKPAQRPDGRVVLAGAHCETLADEPLVWEAQNGLDLEDFSYNALENPIALTDDDTVAQRIAWLRNAMPGYRPGPYDQLAAMLRASGNEEHAETVLMRKQQYRYTALAEGASLPVGWLIRLWSWLQRGIVGYGYRPGRALGVLVALLVLGSLWFGVGVDDCVHDPELQENVIEDKRCVVNADDSGMVWNSVLFTADLLVPIADFGNKGRWQMDGLDLWVATGYTAMGWVLATTVAAGVTRALRRNGT